MRGPAFFTLLQLFIYGKQIGALLEAHIKAALGDGYGLAVAVNTRELESAGRNFGHCVDACGRDTTHVDSIDNIVSGAYYDG